MDPVTGTFTSMDTYAGSLSEPMSLHKYLFANSNPVMYSDPSGQMSKEEIIAVIQIQLILLEAYLEPCISCFVSNGFVICVLSEVIIDYLKYLHFEYRNELNKPYPSYEEVQGRSWVLLPADQSIYHDNGVGKPEEKYIHPDGREAVFDGDTHEPITDPRYMATYNYCPPMPLPDNPTLPDYAVLLLQYIGHFIFDVFPYWIWGNERRK